MLAFGLGVAAVVVGRFGCIRARRRRPSRALGAVFLAVGEIYAVVRKQAQPAAARMHSVAVIDRKLGLFSYGRGAVVPYDRVHFARKLQIGSELTQTGRRYTRWVRAFSSAEIHSTVESATSTRPDGRGQLLMAMDQSGGCCTHGQGAIRVAARPRSTSSEPPLPTDLPDSEWLEAITKHAASWDAASWGADILVRPSPRHTRRVP